MESNPSTEPGVRDPLAAVLMPVLLHRINNATQVITSLNALLALDGEATVLERRAGDLAYASAVIDDLGWVLALLASACGANALLERRHAQGLRPIVASVREALRREGRDVEMGAELPDLEPEVADGWQLPWAFGSWLWACARARTDRTPLDWCIERSAGRWSVLCTAALNDQVATIARTIQARLPASEFEFTPTVARWSLPETWMKPRGDPR